MGIGWLRRMGHVPGDGAYHPLPPVSKLSIRSTCRSAYLARTSRVSGLESHPIWVKEMFDKNKRLIPCAKAKGS